MYQSIQNFQELHINLCLNMHCLDDYLKTIGRKIENNRYFIVTNDGNCWIIDPIAFNASFTEKDCTADGKIKTLPIVSKYIKKIKIPSSITNIGYAAFDSCSGLMNVTIGNGVTNIGGFAFSGCSSLASVTIPNSVTSIGYSAFDYCNSLTNVTIGNGVTNIGTYAFYNCCRLTSMTIPDSVTNIGDKAFEDCQALTSVTIPTSVMSIGSGAFYSCKNLKNLIFEGRTLDKVRRMEYYPWGIEDESIIKVG